MLCCGRPATNNRRGQTGRPRPFPHFVQPEAVKRRSSDVRGTIIYNGKIATNAIPSFVGAIAVEGGKVSATGNSDELLRLADPMTTVIDAKGRPYGVL
jgi:hypothetical protein